MVAPASAYRERAVNLEYLVGGIIAALLTVYLVYALLRPERF
jgi:K+-transporting ATPase KdpF subunit